MLGIPGVFIADIAALNMNFVELVIFHLLFLILINYIKLHLASKIDSKQCISYSEILIEFKQMLYEK